MSLRLQRRTALLMICVFAAVVGCRQTGTRSPAVNSTPSLILTPESEPANSTGPSLPEVPPPPPATAKLVLPSDASVETAAHPLSGNQYFPAAEQSAEWNDESRQPTFGLPIPLPQIENVVGIEPANTAETDMAVVEEELSGLVPSAMTGEADDGLVPAPRDAEEELEIRFEVPVARAPKVVDLDVTEFLVELDQTPPPIKALTVVAPEPSVLQIAPAPQPLNGQKTSLEKLPANDAAYGIVVTPGPAGTGNRLENFANPARSRRAVASEAPSQFDATKQWAEQNLDWVGRLFR